MDVALSGSRGLIGSALRRDLEAGGHHVRPLVRPGAPGPGIAWDPVGGTIDAGGLEGVDAVVHLAGEGVASHRWTDEHRQRVRDSRVLGTTLLAGAVAGLERKPRVFVSGSAVGYYGDRGDEELTESSPSGSDFLAELCRAWEVSTAPVQAAGVRTVHIRTGIVLSTEGGALAKQLLPYRLGLGGPAGRGDQWLPWISLDDEVGAIRFLIDDDGVSGPVNLTAPRPVPNAEFAKTLGRVLHRPTFVRIPRFVTKAPAGVGPLADNLLFSSQRVLPSVLAERGFRHQDPDLEPALRRLLGRPAAA